MRIALLLLLLSVGASALKRIIHRISEKKTWHDAQAYCRQHHTDLLTIRDQAENEELTDDGWIGLYREPNYFKCKWSDGHVNDNFCIWNTVYDTYCGFKAANEWFNIDCSNTFAFYCVDDPLVLVKEEKTWEKALEYCRNLPQSHSTIYPKFDYTLAAAITDADDTQYVFQDNVNKVWIGLRYLGDKWLWLNGQNYIDSWQICPSIDRCATLENDGTTDIVRQPCDPEYFFLCTRK